MAKLCILAVALNARSVLSSDNEWNRPFLGLYKPTINVDTYSAFDIDQRAIKASVSSHTKSGLTQGYEIYSGNGGDSSFNLWRLANRMHIVLGGSPTVQLYLDYYGVNNFADVWLEHAYEGETSEEFDKGNSDFSQLDVEGRSAAVRYGTPALLSWPYVVGLLEVSATKCKDESNQDAMKHWDEAVALYVGSVARDTGKGGYMLYTLANEECYRFGRCKKGERSPINTEIFELFNSGQTHLRNGKCADAFKDAYEIGALMKVPLIQAAGRAMYALDVEDIHRQSTQGEAAAYGAALLPLMNDCGQGNGHIMYNNMFPGKASKGSYEVVKASFERCYDHFGITCKHVGGLVNYSLTGYSKNAEACEGVQPVDGILVKFSNRASQQSPTSSSSVAESSQPQNQSSSSGGVNIALIISLSAMCTLFLILMVVALNKRKSRDEREFAPPNEVFQSEQTAVAVDDEEGNEII